MNVNSLDSTDKSLIKDHAHSTGKIQGRTITSPPGNQQQTVSVTISFSNSPQVDPKQRKITDQTKASKDVENRPEIKRKYDDFTNRSRMLESKLKLEENPTKQQKKRKRGHEESPPVERKEDNRDRHVLEDSIESSRASKRRLLSRANSESDLKRMRSYSSRNRHGDQQSAVEKHRHYSEIRTAHAQADHAATTHSFPMAGTQYLEMIQRGDKKYEGRVNGPACRKIRVGDQIKFFDRRAGWGILCEVTEKRVFNTFEQMLGDVGESALLPHLKEKFRSMAPDQVRSEALRVYQSFPGSNRVKQHGCIAIGVKFINRI